MKKALDQNRLLSTLAEIQPRKGDLKRVRVVQLAIDCIAKEGVDSLTFDWVAKRAKMSRSHVIYYFSDREALVEAAIHFVCQVAETYVAKAIQGETSPDKQILAAVAANFQCFEENPNHFPVILLLLARGSNSKKNAAFVAQVRQIGHARWVALLSQAGPEKKRNPRTLSETASLVQAIIVGYLTRFSEGADPKQIASLRTECVNQVKRLLGSSLF